MKRGSLLAVLAILALCFQSRVALAGSSKSYGGNVDQFAAWATRFNQTGEPFKIEGICQSACTIFLRIKQVCIVPDSTFRFHAGHTDLPLSFSSTRS